MKKYIRTQAKIFDITDPDTVCFLSNDHILIVMPDAIRTDYVRKKIAPQKCCKQKRCCTLRSFCCNRLFRNTFCNCLFRCKKH